MALRALPRSANPSTPSAWQPRQDECGPRSAYVPCRGFCRTAAWVTAVRRKLGESAYDAAWYAGGTLTVDEAIDVARSVLDGQSAATNLPGSPLTRRETEVAALVARGLSTSGIAAELVISVATVRVHVDHIMAKLDLHSRIQIAAWVKDHASIMAVQTAPTRD